MTAPITALTTAPITPWPCVDILTSGSMPVRLRSCPSDEKYEVLGILKPMMCNTTANGDCCVE